MSSLSASRKTKTAAIALAVVWLVAAATTQASPFQNGSFEIGTAPGSFTTVPAGGANITGWTITGNGVDYIGSYWAAAEGSRSLDLNALNIGGVEQEFDTVIGQRYRVTFAIAGNPDGGPAIKTLDVFADGVDIGDASFNTTGKSKAAPGWVDVSLEFLADEALTTIAFVSSTTANSGNSGFPFAFGPALDNVRIDRITDVPEPAALGLLGAGLVGLGLARRRRG